MSVENMQTRTTFIGGDEWSHNPFSATTGIGYLKRLFKIFGQSFSVLIDATDPEAEDGIAKAVALLTDNIDKDDVVQLVKALTFGVKKNNKEVNFDIEFAANYGTLFKVVTFIVKENYGSFFPSNATASE